VLVDGQMTYLVEKWKLKSVLAALIILLEVIICVFVPLYFLVWMLFSRIQDVNFDISQLIETVKHLIALIREKTTYDLLSVNNIETATSYLTKSVQFIISHVGGLLITTLVMLFFLYFMLIRRKDMEAFVYALLPFNEEYKHAIMKEILLIVRSNAIGIPILAFIHGTVAVIGYWIVGVPSFMLFGVLTGMASIIPFISGSIVWIPLFIYFILTGNWIAAFGLLAYCLVVLVNIDNVLRFLLQKKLADIHPLITVFGVILGLKLFGFWGIIFGPLLLSMFFLLINIFKKDYLEKK
jgi:predicted PurR-regulated permease PerM